ncbi:hypothetical protein DFA_08124 [Cavenderia fasciculata]|uniref:F-box domain-containing protein n=1 Tax=Cavenderia fasciculata TaxID=261658 RepID=F4Q583_CACFS|nr:uncharacterized protein DFA_08124 [Cavenderia fasciculata]EGG17142.1 hypothetical protein DFA_08124 [Cavenderia fasciculata]|eukprot:XP_004355626.1 hypothetical protein DFA_08124 [Cavenderia fasciculata]
MKEPTLSKSIIILPWIIQQQIIEYFWTTKWMDRHVNSAKSRVQLALVCWRWFDRCSHLTNHFFIPSLYINYDREFRRHLESRYCLLKCIAHLDYNESLNSYFSSSLDGASTVQQQSSTKPPVSDWTNKQIYSTLRSISIGGVVDISPASNQSITMALLKDIYEKKKLDSSLSTITELSLNKDVNASHYQRIFRALPRHVESLFLATYNGRSDTSSDSIPFQYLAESNLKSIRVNLKTVAEHTLFVDCIPTIPSLTDLSSTALLARPEVFNLLKTQTNITKWNIVFDRPFTAPGPTVPLHSNIDTLLVHIDSKMATVMDRILMKLNNTTLDHMLVLERLLLDNSAKLSPTLKNLHIRLGNEFNVTNELIQLLTQFIQSNQSIYSVSLISTPPEENEVASKALFDQPTFSNLLNVVSAHPSMHYCSIKQFQFLPDSNSDEFVHANNINNQFSDQGESKIADKFNMTFNNGLNNPKLVIRKSYTF